MKTRLLKLSSLTLTKCGFMLGLFEGGPILCPSLYIDYGAYDYSLFTRPSFGKISIGQILSPCMLAS